MGGDLDTIREDALTALLGLAAVGNKNRMRVCSTAVSLLLGAVLQQIPHLERVFIGLSNCEGSQTVGV